MVEHTCEYNLYKCVDVYSIKGYIFGNTLNIITLEFWRRSAHITT